MILRIINPADWPVSEESAKSVADLMLLTLPPPLFAIASEK